MDGYIFMCIWVIVIGFIKLLKNKRYEFLRRRCGEILEEMNRGVEGEYDIKKYIVFIY